MGIAPDIVSAAIEHAFEGSDERTLIERAIDRRLKSSHGRIDDPAAYRRLYGHLLRQGFASSTVSAALRARARGVAPEVADE